MQAFTLSDRMIAPVPIAGSAADRAMEVFRKFSTFSILSCWVSRDGKQMHYRIMRPAKHSEFDERCQEYLKQARLIISVFNLPLHPELDQCTIGEVVIGASLILKYIGE